MKEEVTHSVCPFQFAAYHERCGQQRCLDQGTVITTQVRPESWRRGSTRSAGSQPVDDGFGWHTPVRGHEVVRVQAAGAP